MVQSIDNLTALSGTVVARAPHSSLPGYEVVTLRVNAAEPVADRANLLGHQIGSDLPVAVRTPLLGAAVPGTTLRLRAKMTPNGAMAESAPDAKDFVIGT